MVLSRVVGGFVQFIKLRAPWLGSAGSEVNHVDNVKRYRGADPQLLQLKQARSGRCLLSIGGSVHRFKESFNDRKAKDGGGTRGFSQIFILEEIASRIMHELGLAESPPLCDYFDIIGGVGTGGYLAILAGRLGLTIPQLKEEFKQLIAYILGGPISPDELDKFLKAVVERYTGDSETRMFDPNSPTSHCKTFVGAVTVGNMSYLTNFRSYESRDPPLDIPIWQAARATLSHPRLFPSTRIGPSNFEQVYVSGEIGWKNPSNEVIREFEALWPFQNIACFTSIGSGHEGVIQINGSSVSDFVAEAMGRIATDCERIAQEIAYRFQGRNTYFRLSVEQGLQQSAHLHALTLPEIEAHTRSYLGLERTNNTLGSLVATLLHSVDGSGWTKTKDHFETTMEGFITEYSRFVDDIPVETVQSAAHEGVILLETIQNAKSDENNLLKFAETIVNQFNSLNHRSIKDIKEPPSSNPLWPSLKKYFSEVNVVRRSLKKLLKINPHRIWGPPTHETFLAKAAVNLDECSKLVENAVLNNIHDCVVAAKQDARFDRLVSWISRLNMKKRHEELLARRTPGAGAWLMDTAELKAWLGDQRLDECGALFGCGDPGAGKTFICCATIEHLRAIINLREAALIYIYCDYRDRQDLCSMLGELAKQLLLQSSTIPDATWQLFEKRETLTTEIVKKIFTLLLPNFKSIYIFLDALDECLPHLREDLLCSLTSSRATTIRMFCTGRSSVAAEAKRHLGSLGFKTMEIYAHEADIRLHLKEQISRDRRKDAMDDQLQEQITNRLIRHRLFILASLHLQFILEQITPRARREALDTLPTKLSEIYDATFIRIRQRPTSEVDMAMTILTWIYLAGRKLRVHEIQHALATRGGDTRFIKDGIPSEDAILDCCLGLVVIEASTIRLTHSTLQEYLDKRWQGLFPLGHSEIAFTCLTYLNFSFDDPYPPHFRSSPAPNLIDYATKFVGHHLYKNTNPELDQQVLDLLVKETKFRLLEQAMRENDGCQTASPLHWAACHGLVSISRLLLEGPNKDIINARNEEGQTAIFMAARHGHEGVVRLFVDLDLKDNDGRTPLSYAAEGGHKAVVRWLLGTGAVQFDSMDAYARTPLSYAAVHGHEAVVRLLLHPEISEAGPADEGGRTPLSYAAENGHEAVVRLLLTTKGVKVYSRDSYGCTALLYSAMQGHEAIARLLLSAEDTEIDSSDFNGRTALSYAAMRGHVAVVGLMLGIETLQADLKDNYGRTPLSYAAAEGRRQVVQLLLDKEGINVNSIDINGRTPLSYAVADGNETVVNLLLGVEGIEVDQRDNYGLTPLSYAAKRGREAAISLLLDTEAVDVDSKDSDGRTPLSYAAQGGHEAVVRLLLDIEDVGVDPRDKYGRTPLSYAAMWGHETVVRLLLDTGEVEVDSKDSGGYTALLHASEKGHKAVAELLLGPKPVNAAS